MADKWRRKVAKSHINTVAKYPYKEPFLSKPDNDDLSKQWVVEYGVWSEREEIIKRKRVVITGTTLALRLSEAKAVITELRKVLRKGVCVDPLRANPIAGPVKGAISIKTLLRQAVEAYLEYKKQTTKKNSYRTYRSNLNVLLNYLTDTPGMRQVTLGNFHPGDAQHFLDQCILTHRLTNRGHNNAKDNAQAVFLHWMKRINVPGARDILTNPFDGITDKVTVSRKHTAFTDEQRTDFRKMCETMQEQNLLLFVQFMFYTFFRPREELRNLRVSDILDDTIRVSGDTAKDNAEEFIELAPPLKVLIEANKLRTYPGQYYVFTRQGIPGPERVGPDFFYQHHCRVLARLAWQGNYDMYSWKHTGVIALWNITQNIRLVQQHCRHSTAAQTEEYLRDLGIVVRNTQIQDFPEF